jgi:hypothetical protein
MAGEEKPAFSRHRRSSLAEDRPRGMTVAITMQVNDA